MAQQTITAFYDSREYANNAALMLGQAGMTGAQVSAMPALSDAAAAGDAGEKKGLWRSLEDLFGGSDDHPIYVEGLRRGGIMVAVQVNDDQVEDAVAILEQHGSVDLDEREAAWRREGWTGAPAPAPRANEAGPVESTASGTLARASIADVSTTARSAASLPTPAIADRRDDTIEVVEERLRVGKRAVNRGRVRIHAHVVETPVTETVTLRDETVRVERRPVDRLVDAEEVEAGFRERSIEMNEVDEEAVVAKTARIVEEIGLRKEASDRTETIRDSVRSTRVEIEDGRGGDAEAGLVGDAAGLAKDMEVVGSDGVHVGVIDRVEGNGIKLKADPASGGTHHMIPTASIAAIDAKVTLRMPASTVKAGWTRAG